MTNSFLHRLDILETLPLRFFKNNATGGSYYKIAYNLQTVL